MNTQNAEKIMRNQYNTGIFRAPDGSAAGVRSDRVGDNRLRLESFFLGDTVGHGVIHDRFGRLIGEATAEMSGSWRDDIFLLDELFRYTDGRTQARTWSIRLDGNRGYRITAPEMVGEGRGTASGNSLALDYRLRVPVGGREMTLRFDDRMYLLDDGVLINTSTAKKFGITLARLAFSFRRAG
jgi:hypothetical protein